MSGCCREPNCRRTEPIDLVLADLSGIVYAVMSKRVVKDHGDGTATFAMGNRHDVTDRMQRFIRANPVWVRSALPVAEACEVAFSEWYQATPQPTAGTAPVDAAVHGAWQSGWAAALEWAAQR